MINAFIYRGLRRQQANANTTYISKCTRPTVNLTFLFSTITAGETREVVGKRQTKRRKINFSHAFLCVYAKSCGTSLLPRWRLIEQHWELLPAWQALCFWDTACISTRSDAATRNTKKKFAKVSNQPQKYRSNALRFDLQHAKGMRPLRVRVFLCIFP